MSTEDRWSRTFGVWVIPTWLAFVAAALVFAGGYVVDDAYVVFRVAERFAAGQAWAFQGSAPVDGVTSPLWGLLLAALTPLGATPLLARLLGSACLLAGGALSLSGVHGAARAYAALFLAAQLPMVVWAGAGLETGLATLVVAVIAPGIVRAGTASERHVRSEQLGGVGARVAALIRAAGLACVAWVRPELVPLGVVAAWQVSQQGAAGRQVKRRVGGVLAVFLGTVSVVVLRLVAFGHALPLAALAKPSDPAQGARYVALALLSSGALTALLGVVFVHAVVPRARHADDAEGTGSARLGPSPLRAGLAAFNSGRVGVVVGVGLLSVVLAGGDWMPAGRLLVPLLPLFAVSVGGALASLPRYRGLVAALTLLFPLATGLAAVPELRSQPEARARGAALVLEALAGAEHVALVDVGYLAYVGRFQVVDLGGITDLEIARLPGGHLQKRIPESLLLARGVDAIVLHSSTRPSVGAVGTARAVRLLGLAGYPVETLVARMPFVREQFRVVAQVAYAPDYHYVVLRRLP